MNLSFLIQLFIIIIVLGIIYNLWRTARSFGGLIGNGLKWIGVGILVFSLEALDRVLGDMGFVRSFAGSQAELVHNFLLILGLLSSGIGFSKLTRIAK